MAGSPLPLLFLDVDGPLIPFGATRQQLPDGYPTFGEPGPNPLLSRLDPSLGPRLRALPCELVWATTWMSDANEYVAPRLGLPELPLVDWPDPPLDEGTRGLHWKTPGLAQCADGRPFAWVDDEITDVDRTWVEAYHPGQSLLHRVEAWQGLTGADFTTLETWLRRNSP
ncbi:hypothetical protein [Streptomyces sp. NBC_01012]|uniref:hypothetical protein n=1 Tax=Streptomyces sp. NBC_01012 TaxID=2903717 RepID=UPI00386FCBC5|nr:hypothetical protein OG623_24960 [Streptomyces sp. NBC_01012]